MRAAMRFFPASACLQGVLEIAVERREIREKGVVDAD
jgi:hypothetical protein